jgi:hypothetical protein
LLFEYARKNAASVGPGPCCMRHALALSARRSSILARSHLLPYPTPYTGHTQLVHSPEYNVPSISLFFMFTSLCVVASGVPTTAGRPPEVISVMLSRPQDQVPQRITVTAYWELRGPRMEDAGRVMRYHHFLLHDWCIEVLVHELTIGNQQRLSRFPRRWYQRGVYDDRNSLFPVNSSASWLG